MNKKILIAILAWFAATSVVAQLNDSTDPTAAGFSPQRLARIDNAINAEISSGKIPGAVALIARNGKIVYQKSFGFADIDTQKPMQTSNIFRLASMTKAVTAVAVMMLYEQGRFQLNDPLAKYIPAFAHMQVLTAVDADGNLTTADATRPIRIIDLLTHTSGIAYPFMPGKLQQIYANAGVIDGLTDEKLTLQSQMELLARQPLLFEPGSAWTYGLSFDVLGYLVEVISGKPLDRFFAEEIFAPLGMNDTYFYLPEAKAERLVTMYSDVAGKGLVKMESGDPLVQNINPRYPVEGAHSYFSGGAGLSSTALDYARFLQMLLNEGSFDGTRVLSRKSVELIRTARADIDRDGNADFGLGFYITELKNAGELGSSGSYSWGGAFNTIFWIDPTEKIIAVYMGQTRPVQSDIKKRFQTLVYQALE